MLRPMAAAAPEEKKGQSVRRDAQFALCNITILSRSPGALRFR